MWNSWWSFSVGSDRGVISPSLPYRHTHELETHLCACARRGEPHDNGTVGTVTMATTDSQLGPLDWLDWQLCVVFPPDSTSKGCHQCRGICGVHLSTCFLGFFLSSPPFAFRLLFSPTFLWSYFASSLLISFSLISCLSCFSFPILISLMELMEIHPIEIPSPSLNRVNE